MANKLVLLAAILAGLLLPACQTTRELAREYDPGPPPEQLAYEKAIAPYLTQANLHQGPATELMARTLPLTSTVRAAMLERETVALTLNPQARAKRQADHQAEAAHGLKVALSFYVPDKKYNDLTHQNPSWRVFLLTPQGERISPRDLRRIKKRTPLLDALYPFWGMWDRLYHLTFPPLAGINQATLVISGVPGQVNLPLKLGLSKHNFQ